MDNMLQTSLKSLLPLNIDKYNGCKWRLVAVKFFSQYIIYKWSYMCDIYDALSELIRPLTYVRLKWITAQSQRNKFLERTCRSTTRYWEVYWVKMIKQASIAQPYRLSGSAFLFYEGCIRTSAQLWKQKPQKILKTISLLAGIYSLAADSANLLSAAPHAANHGLITHAGDAWSPAASYGCNSD